MMVSTTFTIEGYRILEYKGLVRGLTVRSPTIGQGISGGLQSILGGKIDAYTKMCDQTRQQAYNLCIKHAKRMGANAILGFRFDASEVVNHATEVLCYGTAVIIAPEE